MIQNGNTKDFSLPASVQSMKDIPISGNVIPMTWFQTITFDNGKPDTNSIIILSDIVYWYRPTEVRDERTGAVLGYKLEIHTGCWQDRLTAKKQNPGQWKHTKWYV